MTSHTEVVDFLSRGSAWPEGGPVEVRETHISVVFLTPQFAWKLCKPVNFGFLDFTTLEARHADCLRELELNRRLAPDVYRDVVPVTERDGRLQVGGDGGPVEWLVKMRRLPDEATLAARIEAGAAERSDIDRLLEVLVPFFRQAPTDEEISRGGRPEVIRRNVEENLSALETAALESESRIESPESRARDTGPSARMIRPSTLDSGLSTLTVRSALLQFLTIHEELFERRIAEGRIRDGHGDLRAEHVYLTDPPVVVDCIEFNDRFRHADVLDEFCFLAIDLERLGRDDLADYLLQRYRELMDDPAPAELAGFYKAYRSSVRAKVACLRAGEQTGEERSASLSQAAAHLEAARRHMQAVHRPVLVVMCGVSGSGKSSTARLLAERIGAAQISSDVVRKRLHGFEPLQRPDDPDLYSAAASRATYNAMSEQARQLLTAGASVVLDATYQRREHRQKALSTAASVGAPALLVWCRAPADVARQRVGERIRRGDDPSDADPAVLERQLAAFEPPDEVAEPQLLTLDARRPAGELWMQIVSRLSVM